jgi:pimeloyl-ACP methyl ester carboxylesterase
MAVRTDGRDVPLERSALAAAFPQAGERVVVFVHGLCGSEHSWIPTAGPELSFGARLESDLGWTPVFIRYNSGLHISESGRSLAGLLEELLRAWPVPVIELALVGHSMGGLVCRSACHYGQAAGDAWTSRLRHVFCLGSPHLGAPLEKTANAAAVALGLVAETRPFARLLNLRSVGIKDLRFGALVEDDWQGRDPDAFLADTCSDVALLPAVRYHAIAATVTASARHPVGHVFGDLLVRLPSASGEGRRRRIGFDFEPRHRLGGLHHFHLLHHPAVYELIREALASGPGGRPAAVERQLPRDLPRLRRGRQSRG